MSKTNKNAIIFTATQSSAVIIFSDFVVIKELQKDVIDSFEVKNVIITFKSIPD